MDFSGTDVGFPVHLWLSMSSSISPLIKVIGAHRSFVLSIGFKLRHIQLPWNTLIRWNCGIFPMVADQRLSETRGWVVPVMTARDLEKI